MVEPRDVVLGMLSVADSVAARALAGLGVSNDRLQGVGLSGPRR